MKKVLYSFVILSLLVTNMAWAWDSHDEILTGHVSVEVGLTAFNDSPGSEDPDQHDHYCCCGVAHVVALGMSSPSFEDALKASSVTGYRSTFLSYIPLLRNRPPRV